MEKYIKFLKNLIRRYFLTLFDSVAFRLGYTKKEMPISESIAKHIHKNDLLSTFFNIIKSVPFLPEHIMDIGANHGTWTREALKVFPNAKFTLLEPQEKLKASINDLLVSHPKITFHAVGAGKKAGIFKFTIVDRDDSSNFYMSENTKIMFWYDILRNEETSLDGYTTDVRDNVFTCRVQFKF